MKVEIEPKYEVGELHPFFPGKPSGLVLLFDWIRNVPAKKNRFIKVCTCAIYTLTIGLLE
jgi:hypothetical protein